MKKLIFILMAFTMLLAMTTVVSADWPSNYGVEPEVSYGSYPYRIMIYNQWDNAYYYFATSKKFIAKVNSDFSGPGIVYSLMPEDGKPMYILRYKMVIQNNTPTWVFDLDYGAGAVSKWDYDIKYANYDLYKIIDGNIDNKIFMRASDVSTLTGTVTFISPMEGMKDNVNMFSFLANYSVTIPPNADKNKLKIEITGGVAGSGEVLSHDFKTVDGKWNGTIRFSRVVYPGENTIRMTVKYDGKTVASAVRKVIYFDDFIDVDEDGIDDRTGQPEVPDRWELPIQDNAPDGTILGYIRWAFENIGYLIDGVIGLVEGLFKMTGKMANIMGEYMGFLPKPINTILIIGCMAAIVLKIFGR